MQCPEGYYEVQIYILRSSIVCGAVRIRQLIVAVREGGFVWTPTVRLQPATPRRRAVGGIASLH